MMAEGLEKQFRGPPKRIQIKRPNDGPDTEVREWPYRYL